MIRVVVADDHAVIRRGIKGILASEPDIQVNAEASTVAELQEVLKRQSVEGVILDLSMPGGNGLDGLKKIKAEYPQLPVLILSIHPEDQYAVRALKAGAAGYLSKECAPEQLVDAIRSVMRGEVYVTNKVTHLMQNALRGKNIDPEAPHTALSDREFQVMMLIGEGTSLTDIAKDFCLSVKTVSTYRDRILKKLNMKSNADIIHYLISHELQGTRS